MPIYEYRCAACGFQHEYLQRVSDPLLTDCPQCGKSAFKKLVTAAGFQLKGTGWYATDFKNNGAKPKADKADKSAENSADKAADKSEKSADEGSKSSDKGDKPSDKGDKPSETKKDDSKSQAATGPAPTPAAGT